MMSNRISPTASDAASSKFDAEKPKIANIWACALRSDNHLPHQKTYATRADGATPLHRLDSRCSPRQSLLGTPRQQLAFLKNVVVRGDLRHHSMCVPSIVFSQKFVG